VIPPHPKSAGSYEYVEYQGVSVSTIDDEYQGDGVDGARSHE